MKTKALDMEKRFLILPGFQNHYFDEFLTLYFKKENRNIRTKKSKIQPHIKNHSKKHQRCPKLIFQHIFKDFQRNCNREIVENVYDFVQTRLSPTTRFTTVMRKIALLLLMTLSGVTTSLMAQVNIPGETQGSTQTSPTIPEMNGKGPRVILRQPSSGGLIVPAWIWEQIGSGGSGGRGDSGRRGGSGRSGEKGLRGQSRGSRRRCRAEARKACGKSTSHLCLFVT